MNGWAGRTLDVLLEERIIIWRQSMTTLVAVDRRLERANEYCFFDTAIMPILITRGEDGKVRAPEMVVVVTGMRHNR